MNDLISIQSANTVTLLNTPGLADEIALTSGNATIIPSDDPDAPWKTVVIDIDGKDRIFVCKDTPPDRPKHVKQMLPVSSFDAEGLAYLFRHSLPPPDVLRIMSYDRSSPRALTVENQEMS
jgi:hypothetical protein